jgi:hypothetical protein
MGEVTRRALLAAAAGAVTAPAAAQDGGLRALVLRLRVGANIERWFTIARDNHPRRLGAGWFAELRGAGFDHVRIFLPAVAQTSEDPTIIDAYGMAVRDAVDAGLPVLLGLNDQLHESDAWDAREWRGFAERLRRLAAMADPARVALAAVNEAAFPDTASWLPVRDRLLAQLRAAAPRHTLMWGGREWCSWRSLLEATPPADPNTLAEVHDYVGGDADAVAERFGAVAAWRDRHRVPVVVSEFGGPDATRADRAAHGQVLETALPVLARLGLPVTLWAYTHGGWFRLQEGDGPTPRPEIARALQAARRG